MGKLYEKETNMGKYDTTVIFLILGLLCYNNMLFAKEGGFFAN